MLSVHRNICNAPCNFGATFLDPKTTSFTAPAVVANYVTDRQIPFNYTADRTVTIGARYVLPLDESVGEIALNADLYSTSSTRYTTIRVPGYEVVNARVEWRKVMHSKFDLAVYSRNCSTMIMVLQPMRQERFWTSRPIAMVCPGLMVLNCGITSDEEFFYGRDDFRCRNRDARG